MEQFSLEQYLENPNRKVVTREGKSVRIICVNRLSDDYPIVALILNKDKEVIECYTKDGKFLENKIYNYDLFFAPIKKEGWVNMYKTRSGAAQIGQIYSSKEEAEMCRKDTNYISTAKIEWEE